MRKISGLEKVVLMMTVLFLLMTAAWFFIEIQTAPVTKVEIARRADPVPVETAEVPAPGLLEGEKINLNTASRCDLTRLPGIGETRADAILAYREAHGGFQTVDELLEVSGIGPAIMEAVRAYVIVEGGGGNAKNSGGG